MKTPAFYFRKSRKAPRNGRELLTSGADAAILTGKSENMALPFKYESIYIITMRGGLGGPVAGMKQNGPGGAGK